MLKPIAEQTILITGSTDGIGHQAAIDIAKQGAHVIVHGRTEQRAKAAAAAVAEASKNEKLDCVWSDFSSLSDVQRMAMELPKRFGHLDVLLNNAGVYMKNRMETRDGHEMTFQVNHLAPTYLTLLILNMLDQDAETRIVNVASIAHQSAHLDLDDLENRSWDDYQAYANSKLENVLFTYELARRLHDTDIRVNCLHPGVIGTKLLEKGFGRGGLPIEVGSKVLVHLATSPELEGVTGAYFNRMQQEKSHKISYDEDLALQLWEKTLEMLPLSDLETSDKEMSQLLQRLQPRSRA